MLRHLQAPLRTFDKRVPQLPVSLIATYLLGTSAFSQVVSPHSPSPRTSPATLSTDIYLRDQPTRMLGWGYSFDPRTNSFELRQQVASIPTTAIPMCISDRGRIRDYFGHRESLSQSGPFTDLHSILSVYEDAANFDATASDSSRAAYGSVDATYELEFAPLLADIGSASLTPQALDILSGPDPEENWRAAFGDYLAVGTQPVANAAVRANFVSGPSWSSRNEFFLNRQGLPTSQELDTFVANIFTLDPSVLGYQLALDFSVEGPVSILDVLDGSMNRLLDLPGRSEAAELDPWFDDVKDTLALATPVSRGLILRPMENISFAPPLTTTPIPDLVALQSHLGTILAAVDQLLEANRWREPYSLRAAVDNGGEYASMEMARRRLQRRLERLYSEALHVVATPSTGSMALDAAATAVLTATSQLVTEIGEIEDWTADPGGAIQYSDGVWTDLGNVAMGTGNRIQGSFWLRNLAIFPRNYETAELESLMRSAITIRELGGTCGSGTGPNDIIPDERVTILDVLELELDPTTRLLDVRIRLQVITDVNHPGFPYNICKIDLTVEDEFGRVGEELGICINGCP